MTHFRLFRITLIIAVFITIISFPIINGNLNLIADSANTENKKPSSKPEFDLRHLDHYPEQYDQYNNDNFSFRQRAIALYNWLTFFLFNKSPLPDKVIIGRDGWLFMAGTENDCYQCSNPLTKKELASIKKELEYRTQYHEARGRKFYFMVSPIKANIYPEYLPLGSIKFNKLGIGELLLEYLNRESSVETINLFVNLREQKHHGQMYYKQDNHWNPKGAMIAAEYILKKMSRDVSTVNTITYSNFDFNCTIGKGGNISQMLSNTYEANDSSFQISPHDGFQSEEAAKANYPVPYGFPYLGEYENVREKKESKKPTILIISDSFGSSLFPFVAEGFGRSVKIFDGWHYYRNDSIIENEKPDIVLLMVLESNLRTLTKEVY